MMILKSLSNEEAPQQLHQQYKHQHQQANNNKLRIRTTQPTQRGYCTYCVTPSMFD
jgi:hypothetical protein